MSECMNCNVTSGTAAFNEPEDMTCPAVGFQKIGVCVPVTVTPFANAGNTITKCCGEPVVKSGDAMCPGKKNGVCTFTVSQTICVEVPVVFGAKAMVGDTFVNCMTASSRDICTNCRDDDDDDENQQ